MPAAGQLRNGSPPTSTTPPNNLAPHDSLFLGSAGRWPVAFGSLPNALIAAHNSVQNTSQGFAASCRELQASGLRSPERPGGVLRKNHLCRTADVLPMVVSCRDRYEKRIWRNHLFAKRAAFICHSTPVRLGPFVLRHFPRLSSALSARVSFDMQSRRVPTPRREGAKKRCVKLPDSDLKP